MKYILCLFCLFSIFMSRSYAENYPYRDDVLWVTVPDHDNWLYNVGEDAVINIQLFRYGVPVKECELNYAVAEDMLPPFKKGQTALSGGKASINIGSPAKPGFRDLQLEAILDGKPTRHHIKVGFSPEKLQPFTKEPADFIKFWQKAVEKDKKFPLKYTSEPVEKYSTDKMTCHLIKLQLNDEGRCMYAYLFMPKAKGKFPAVFCPPGAGVKTIRNPMAHRYYAENGMIRLEAEIHGVHPDMPEAEIAEFKRAMGDDYFNIGIESPDTYYLKDVYLGCRRFLDLLTSLPEWDGVNLFTQGGSQGGALALTTAMLDDRVTGAVANHPALSDMNGYLGDKTGGYPHHFRKDKSSATPEAIRTLEYFDVVNFARHLKCPVRMTWGFNDITCPPTTSYEVYNVIPTPKTALITPVNEHWTSANTEYGHFEWIRAHCKTP